MPSQDPGALWRRLKDDVVFRAGTLYAGASWFLVEALDTLQMPASLIRSTALTLALLFVPVLGTAWFWRRHRQDTASAASPDTAPPAAAQGAQAPRSRRGTIRWAAATASLVVLALGLWAFGPRAGGRVVPAAAERIAVLPFHATGSDEAREFGVGLVDLLTAALSDVGPIRTVASRSVLARVGAAGSALDPDEALATARQLGAGSALTGSVTAFGSEIRILAELRDVVSGELLAYADVRGDRGDVMTLADRLAAALLREIWHRRTPVPSVRVAGLTTEVPAALRAWLAGEQHLRAFRADSAVHYFTTAVHADSTFALAWSRLAEAVGWQSIPDARTRRREYFRRAGELADRLPPRERSLLRAYNMHVEGDFAAFDSLRAYVSRYPDDPMGWYHLGDARFHAAYLGLFDDDEIIRPFLEALRLDPSFGIGMVHILDRALVTRDRAMFDSIMPVVRRHGDAARTDYYESAARLTWAPPDSVLAVFTDEVRRHDVNQQRGRINNARGILSRRIRLDPELDPMLHVQVEEIYASLFRGDRNITASSHYRRAETYLAMGRLDEASRELEKQLDALQFSPGPERTIYLAHRRLLAGDASYVPMHLFAADAAMLEALPDSAGARHSLVVYYALTGQAEKTRREMSLRPPVAGTLDPELNRQLHSAWMSIMLGDTASLPVLEEAIRGLGYEDLNATAMMWDDVGRLLTRIPGRETQGVRMIREHLRSRPSATAPLYVELARALERAGDRAGARDAWGHALRYLQYAEPWRQPMVTEVQDALARLAREPAT